MGFKLLLNGSRILLSISLLLFTAVDTWSQSNTDSLLIALDVAIDNKEFYVQNKLDRIAALKDQLKKIPDSAITQQFNIGNELYHEYKIFVYDSAFRYAEKLSRLSYKLKDPTKISYAKVKLAFIFLSSGMFKETFDSLKNIDIHSLPDSSKVDYYLILARSYFDVGNYDNDAFYKQNYIHIANQYLDSAKQFCKPGTYNYSYISNYINLMTGNNDDALKGKIQLLNRSSLTIHQRAVNYNHLGTLYLALGDIDKALAAFIASSIADIQSVTKENASLNSVADILYKKGDIKNAYKLIELAMADALYYGAKQRKIEIGSILPIIATEKLNNVESQRRLWLVYSVVLTMLVLLVIILGFIIVKQVKKLKEQVKKLTEAELIITQTNHTLEEINHRLREADRIKEEYIGYYFTINSDYIDKIEEFKNAIDQKLMTKKFDDIRFIVNNLNLKRQKEELFVGFDKVFLKLFPDFVTLFNSHFKEEDRIVTKENQLLSNELRIFALIRMGIHDTEKIARILGYSVNTIYTYKTKVKSKSLVPNDEFEKIIMKIKTV